MPDALVVLFYVWLAVSVGALAYRTLSRRRRRAPVVTSPQRPAVAPVDRAPAAPTPPLSGSPTTSSPADADAGPPADWPPTPGATPPTPTPTPPEPARPTPVPRPGAGSTSLMEALAGITLPCDLVPLTSVEGRVLGDRELLLITSGHSGFEVSRALGEAIGALGYTLTPMANHDLVATRGNDRVSIAVHDRPEGLLAGKRQEFPTAKPGDVVVELRL